MDEEEKVDGKRNSKTHQKQEGMSPLPLANPQHKEAWTTQVQEGSYGASMSGTIQVAYCWCGHSLICTDYDSLIVCEGCDLPEEDCTCG